MRARSLFLILFAVDSLFTAIYVYFGLGTRFGFQETIPLQWHVGKDWSYPESWGYLKWTFATTISILLFTGTGKKSYIALALVFVLLLLDDSLRGHEQAGRLISIFAFERGITWIDIGHGELMAFGLIGAAAALLLILGGWRASRDIQRQFVTVAVILIAGAFFAVFLDFIRGYFEVDSPFEQFLTVLEDYGETVAKSVLVAYLFHLLLQVRGTTKPLSDS